MSADDGVSNEEDSVSADDVDTSESGEDGDADSDDSADLSGDDDAGSELSGEASDEFEDQGRDTDDEDLLESQQAEAEVRLTPV